MKFHCKLANQIGSTWWNMTPIRLGKVPSGLPTPDTFVLVEREGEPFQRLDVYMAPETYNFATKAVHWGKWIAVGCCNLVYLVSISDGQVVTIANPEEGSSSDYFSDFWIESDYLLAITGRGLTRIEPDGSVQWRNPHLGQDGVTIDNVQNGFIEGQGDMNPPGDWKAFRIKAESGNP